MNRMNFILFVVITVLSCFTDAVHAETETESSPLYSNVTVITVSCIVVLAMAVILVMCMTGGSAGGKPEGSSDKKPSNNPTTGASGTSSGASSKKPENAAEENSASQPQGKENYENIRGFKDDIKKRQTENP